MILSGWPSSSEIKHINYVHIGRGLSGGHVLLASNG